LPALARECARGEITLLVAGDEEAAGPRVDLDSLLLEEMARGRVSPSRLAQQAAAASGETRERVYRRIMELKNRDQDRPPKARALNTMNPESDQSFLERELPVQNTLGLHARAAARILETVRNYDCRIIFSKDGLEADADSILSLLTLDAPLGSTLLARARGPQADQALEALGRLFANGFGENA
jgi:phosphotransferase system HPr (HPr) family protein